MARGSKHIIRYISIFIYTIHKENGAICILSESLDYMYSIIRVYSVQNVLHNSTFTGTSFFSSEGAGTTFADRAEETPVEMSFFSNSLAHSAAPTVEVKLNTRPARGTRFKARAVAPNLVVYAM
jgi:hypothetical protein